MRNDFKSGYLEHSLFRGGAKKGSTWKNHKYYARVKLSDKKYRYFYTQAEYNAYLNGKDKTKKKDSIADILKKHGKKSFDKISNLINKGKKKIDKIISDLKWKKDSKKRKQLSTEEARKEQRKINNSQSTDFAKNANMAAWRKKYNAIFKEKEERAANAKRQSEKVHKNAYDLFARDAKDSKIERQSEHPGIKLKDTVATKDQDMAAVNRDRQIAEKRYEMLMEEYNKAKRNGDWDRANQLVNNINSMADLFNDSSINCASCSIAYDMRRRGYDVTAPKQKGDGFMTEEILQVYKPRNEKAYTKGDFYEAYGTEYKNADRNGNGTVSPVDSRYRAFDTKQVNDIKREILKNNPEGSYGILNEYWYTGGGHSVIWSVEHGDVIIRDCQTNEVRTFEEDLTCAISCNWTRTDDLELDNKAYSYADAQSVTENDVYEEHDPRRKGRT